MKSSVGIILSCCIVLALSFYIAVPSLFAGSGTPKSLTHLKERSNSSINWKSQPDSFWQQNLSAQQFRVCRQAGTERPFSGEYNEFKQEGTFHCSSCGQPLYHSDSKFDSGTGWPSFTAPVSESALTLHPDTSWGMTRVEVRCSRCDAHLGHVFDDGPAPTGKRHCINSICLVHDTHLPPVE